MRRRLAIALVGLVVGAAASIPSGAGAAEVVAAGWWWKPHSGQLAPLPPPPGVPEDGLMVQSAVDGASAIAAVRYKLSEDETAPVLTLRVNADGSNQGVENAIVLACPASTPWNAGSAQAWDDKPVPDCATQAVGELAEDGTSMTFDLAAVMRDQIVNVVLVPGTVDGLPEGLNGATFTLVFDAPASSDLVTTPGTTPTGSSDDLPPPSPSPSGGGSGSGSSFSPPPAAATTPVFAPVAPALPAEEVAAPAPRSPSEPTGAAPSSFVPASAPDRGGARALAIVILALAAIGAALTARRDLLLALLGRQPQAVPAVVAGVGRFARERPGPPPTLR